MFVLVSEVPVECPVESSLGLVIWAWELAYTGMLYIKNMPTDISRHKFSTTKHLWCIVIILFSVEDFLKTLHHTGTFLRKVN